MTAVTNNLIAAQTSLFLAHEQALEHELTDEDREYLACCISYINAIAAGWNIEERQREAVVRDEVRRKVA